MSARIDRPFARPQSAVPPESEWRQTGHVVISETATGVPVIHGFFVTALEAERRLAEDAAKTDRWNRLRIVPASLYFTGVAL